MKQSLLNQYFKLKCFLGNNHLGRALNSLYVNKLVYPKGQEPEVLHIAQNYTGVIWDIGAHVGCFADSLASNPNNHVVCFEPNLSILPILAHNLMLRENVTIVPLAIHDGSRIRTLDQFDFRKPTTNKTKCPTLPPQIAFGLFPGPSLIKIDIEGNEYSLLQNTLFHRHTLIVEWHNTIPWKELTPHWTVTVIDETHTLLTPKHNEIHIATDFGSTH